MIKKVLMLAAFATLLMCMLSAGVLAGYEDGADCWHCGHYHWDDYMCSCGACSDSCTNDDCYRESHCYDCDECLTDKVFCSDCGRCEDCYVDNLYHCLQCGECKFFGETVCEDCLACEECYWQMGSHCIYCEECHYGGEDELCHTCFGCQSCVGEICEYCGSCDDCATNYNEMHCLECGECYENVPQCEVTSGHCEDCCLICEACDICLFDDGLEICEECDLCELCCTLAAEDLDCTCGEYCVLSSDWEEHICSECGTPFCAVEQCETCEKCLDCCESESECSDAMCVEDSEYDEHFCEDCGQCYHDVDMCEHCYDESENRCIECCEAIKEEEGDHEALYRSAWSYTEAYHYHECVYCDQEAHFSKREEHSFDGQGICTVCKYSNGTAGIITQHPKNVTATVTDVVYGGYDSPLSDVNNKVTFSVKAKDAKSYQWYYKCDEGKWTALEDSMAQWEGHKDYPFIEGAKTDTVKLSVPADACYCSYTYKCVVTGNDGVEYTSNTARLTAKHAFDNGYVVAEFGQAIMTLPLADNKKLYTYANIGHVYPCLGDGCEKNKTEKVEPHVFAGDYKVIETLSGEKWHEYRCEICDFPYRVQAEKDDVEVEETKEEKVEIKLVMAVEVKELDEPQAGNKPDYSAHLPNASYKFREVKNDYTENGISWYDITDKKYLKPYADTFKEGHEYQVKVYVIPETGYAFDAKLTGEISGNTAQIFFSKDVAVVSRKYKLSTQIPFTDVSDSDYYAPAVKWAYDTGVTTGTSDTTFGPEETCTRGQVVTFLWRAAGSPEPEVSNNPFKDVKKEDYFYKPVLWAVEKGITAGVSDNEFAPKTTCSSAHIITFLYRAMGVGSDGWYQQAREWAILEGLVDGTGLKVSPDEMCPRGAVVTFLYRYYGK